MTKMVVGLSLVVVDSGSTVEAAFKRGKNGFRLVNTPPSSSWLKPNSELFSVAMILPTSLIGSGGRLVVGSDKSSEGGLDPDWEIRSSAFSWQQTPNRKPSMQVPRT